MQAYLAFVQRCAAAFRHEMWHYKQYACAHCCWDPTCVAGRANCSFWHALGLVDGVAEVAQLDHGRLVGVEQRVLQLDVAVGDAHLVAVVQGQDDLLVEPAAAVLGKAQAAYATEAPYAIVHPGRVHGCTHLPAAAAC